MYQEKLQLILSQLNNDSRDIEIEASEIVTMDGLSMAACLPDGLNEDRVGSVSAGVFAFSQRMANELDIGEIGQVIVKGSKSAALINFASDQTLLALKVKSNAEMDQVSRLASHAVEGLGL